LKLLDLLHRKFNKTIVMVTHDGLAAKQAETIRRLDKGVLIPNEGEGPYRSS
jgi:ABC-type lipoprotein export system ATPase subunit